MSKRNITVLNKGHFPIIIDGLLFPSYEEITLSAETTGSLFYKLRVNKNLRVGKVNNQEWLAKHTPKKLYKINMVYDLYSQHSGQAYVCAINKLASPIIKHLPKKDSNFVERPQPGVNLRFFSSFRINQQGKHPVGPTDVFMSHGIGDKNYWIGEKIADYNYALVPGHAWKERMRLTGYKGEIFEVGYTKLDPLFNGEYLRKKREKPYVVWAPTHGYVYKDRGRSSYPACISLIKEIPDIYETKLALHPTSKLNKKTKQDVTMQELIDADVVIADAGSTLYEAWALGKPVIFPDWLCKSDVLKHFGPSNFEHQIYSDGIGYHAKNMKHLIQLIEIAINCGMREKEKEFIEDIFPEKLRGVAGEQAATALKEIYNKTILK